MIKGLRNLFVVSLAKTIIHDDYARFISMGVLFSCETWGCHGMPNTFCNSLNLLQLYIVVWRTCYKLSTLPWSCTSMWSSTICVLSSEVVLEFCVNLLVFFELFQKKKFYKCKLFRKHCANLPFYCAVVLRPLYKLQPWSCFNTLAQTYWMWSIVPLE